MHWIEYESLLMERDHLTHAERKRLTELEREDDQLGERVANWWVPEIFAGWILLLIIGGVILL